MSKERCEAAKALMKQAVTIMDPDRKACGDGRGIRLAFTYLEDAVMRLDYHMRENGWADVPNVHIPLGTTAGTPQMTREIPRVKSNLAPAAPIPQLKTGLMGIPEGSGSALQTMNSGSASLEMNPPGAGYNGLESHGPPSRDDSDILEDISLL